MTAPVLQTRISDVLIAHGVNIDSTRIYLVRHSDRKRYQLAKYIGTRPLLLYQASQRVQDSFEPGSIVVSFFGNRGGHAVLLGVHHVDERMPMEEAEAQGLREGSFESYDPSVPSCFHIFTELKQFEDLLLRLEVIWTGQEINWRRDALTVGNNFAVAGMVDSLPFTSVHDVSLVMSELRRALKDACWQAALATVQAVYVIADEKTGRHYVGSASGRSGLLQRWTTYAQTGHGHNEELVALLGGEPERANDLRFTVIESFSMTVPARDIRKREDFWKRALISRQHGYNSN